MREDVRWFRASKRPCSPRTPPDDGTPPPPDKGQCLSESELRNDKGIPTIEFEDRMKACFPTLTRDEGCRDALKYARPNRNGSIVSYDDKHYYKAFVPDKRGYDYFLREKEMYKMLGDGIVLPDTVFRCRLKNNLQEDAADVTNELDKVFLYYMKMPKALPLSEEDRDALKAKVEAMHEKNVVHNDLSLKRDVILYLHNAVKDSNGNVYLIDFDLAKTKDKYASPEEFQTATQNEVREVETGLFKSRKFPDVEWMLVAYRLVWNALNPVLKTKNNTHVENVVMNKQSPALGMSHARIFLWALLNTIVPDVNSMKYKKGVQIPRDNVCVLYFDIHPTNHESLTESIQQTVAELNSVQTHNVLGGILEWDRQDGTHSVFLWNDSGTKPGTMEYANAYGQSVYISDYIDDARNLCCVCLLTPIRKETNTQN